MTLSLTLATRDQRIVALAAQGSTWTQLPTGAYLIPSQTTVGVSYAVTREVCQCLGSQHHPERLCVHSRALGLYLNSLPVEPMSEMEEMEPEPQPVRLVPTREDADTITWDRPIHAPISDVDAARIMGRL